VRLDGECGHPGYGVVEHFGAPAGDLPNLRLLHRFCRDTFGRSATRRGLAVRRAYLGRATEQFDVGLPSRPYDRLGVSCAANSELYWKRWRIAKMRYACKACRYYTGSH
jgi:hypothetical protein